jgi:RNA polymerase sigma-70 factor (ECF subfamily)
MSHETPMLNRDPQPTSLPTWRGAELLRRIALQDETALESLYQAIGDRLFSMALHWLRDEGAAREALQDAFLRIWKKASNYDVARSTPFTWCSMILRGICLDLMRKRRRFPHLFDDLQSSSNLLPTLNIHDGLDDLLFHDTVTRVREALRLLTAEDRETIEAALFDPAANRELAERWQLPLATAKTRIHRAMLKLRQLLMLP